MHRVLTGLIILFALGLTACGTSSQTPTPTAAPLATATPSGVASPVSPPGSGLAPATPAFVTPGPGATQVARSDCPAGWIPYVNQSLTLSVCAPAGAIAVADVTELGEPRLTVAADLGGVSNKNLPQFAVSLGISSRPEIPGADLSSYGAASDEGSTPAAITTAEGTANGCDTTIERNSADRPLRTLHVTVKLSVPSATGLGFVNLGVNWRIESGGAEDIARGIANSVRVER